MSASGCGGSLLLQMKMTVTMMGERKMRGTQTAASTEEMMLLGVRAEWESENRTKLNWCDDVCFILTP